MRGGARGADALAKDWAMTHPDIVRFECKADWKRYGPAAGPIRNQRMLDWSPDLVVAFAGGKGLLTWCGGHAPPASRLSSPDLPHRVLACGQPGAIIMTPNSLGYDCSQK
jgi:hypothetical protein